MTFPDGFSPEMIILVILTTIGSGFNAHRQVLKNEK